jgi:transposase
MEGRQRRSFTDDYKRQAVDLVASSGRSIGSVAKELGLRDSVLRRWREQRGARLERRRRRGAPQRRRRCPASVTWSASMRMSSRNNVTAARQVGADQDPAAPDRVDVSRLLALGPVVEIRIVVVVAMAVMRLQAR